MSGKLKVYTGNSSGVSLLELLGVIVVVAVMVSIAARSVTNGIDEKRIQTIASDMITILEASDMYFLNNKSDSSVDMQKMYSSGFLKDFGTVRYFKVSQDANNPYTEVFAISGNIYYYYATSSPNGGKPNLYSLTTSLSSKTYEFKPEDSSSRYYPIQYPTTPGSGSMSVKGKRFELNE